MVWADCTGAVNSAEGMLVLISRAVGKLVVTVSRLIPVNGVEIEGWTMSDVVRPGLLTVGA